MSDDIVTRLRDKFQGQLPICSEAADEIERLRAELDYWKALPYCPRCGCGQCQDNEQVLNND